MKVVFSTICLDGMPWIKHHLEQFEKLTFDWRWVVVEGVASSVNCTSWCREIPGRVSKDGTHEYLRSIVSRRSWCCGPVCKPPKISHSYRACATWEGKLEMVNWPLSGITEPCLLWQIDGDELWSTEQITRMRQMFIDQPEKNCAYFYCDYYVGPDIKITSRNTYGNYPYEWLRCWRYEPGMRFESHEPPRIAGFKENRFTHQETEAAGLVFRHLAYATREQVAFKQAFYGRESGWYNNAVEEWERLQKNDKWPVKLSQWLSWVRDDATANRVKV